MHYQINVFLDHGPSDNGPSEPDHQFRATTWEEAMADVIGVVESYLSFSGEESSPLSQETLVTG